MSDIFAPPPSDGGARTKPPLCRADGPDGARCSLYRDHRSVEHADQKRNIEWADLPAPKTWRHTRKGPITGHLVSLDDTWARIRIVGDHELRMFVQDGHRDDGEIVTVRASFLVPAPTAEDVIP